jgi:hypothetical protein
MMLNHTTTNALPFIAIARNLGAHMPNFEEGNRIRRRDDGRAFIDRTLAPYHVIFMPCDRRDRQARHVLQC